MEQTIEAKVAQTILQQPEEMTIGGKIFQIAPPSVATLILASEVVSNLPQVHLNEDKLIEESLSIAKDCRLLGDLLAILILGAKHINDLVVSRQKQRKRHLWGLFYTTKTIVKTETAKDALSRELLENITPRELHSSIAKIIAKMQIGDFFGLTTFLTEINLIRPTKVVTEPTASGL
ncbi:MAG: hypothetical protein HDS59_00325 [Barnesiella sp.]|nr:hypothetical protein [Barnesiella sp.]